MFKQSDDTIAQLREAWLNDLASRVQPFMETSAKLTFPDFRVSCGFPSRGGKSGKVIGECWSAASSADRHAEIFITPFEDRPEGVASTLVHELIHAALPKAGHRAPFQRAAKALGFDAPWKSTPETEVFWAWVRPILADMPAYPHGKIQHMEITGAPKPQKGRLLKVECDDCGYTARVTRKWIDDVGAPICPCNHAPMVCEGVGGGEEVGGDD